MAHLVPLGFSFAGVACGIKRGGQLDLALVCSDRPCAAAATFTRNAFPAAPVLYDRALVAENPAGLRAAAINSGCANACTGDAGLADAAEMARLAERAAGLPARACAVMSTGVIGPRLPMAQIAEGVRMAAGRLAAAGWDAAARAVMTTDTRPKVAGSSAEAARLFGFAKGSGMIHPNMATMLAVVVTDAAIAPDDLSAALRRAVDVSFNCISVDGDTSTNDTVLVLANGAAGPVDHGAFAGALTGLCTELAQQIVRDGEGATKLIAIRVLGATTDGDARAAGKAIANSPLVKTAFYGGDANWGRILAAVGNSGAAVDPARTALWVGEGAAPGAPLLQLVRAGQPLAYAEEAAAAVFAGKEILVQVDLALGAGDATVWTCDLSHEYVSINGHYRT